MLENKHELSIDVRALRDFHEHQLVAARAAAAVVAVVAALLPKLMCEYL